MLGLVSVCQIHGRCERHSPFKKQFKLMYSSLVECVPVGVSLEISESGLLNGPGWSSPTELRLQLPDGSLICRSRSGQLQQSQVTRAQLITPPPSKKHPRRPRQTSVTSLLLLKTEPRGVQKASDRGPDCNLLSTDLLLGTSIPPIVTLWNSASK